MENEFKTLVVRLLLTIFLLLVRVPLREDHEALKERAKKFLEEYEE